MFRKFSPGTAARRYLPVKAILAAVVASSLGVHVQAGEFTISPIRIYMSPQDRAVAITITNEGDEPLVMQADLYTWHQTPDGQEVLELSEDIFLSPPIIRLEPNSRQVVRLARLTSATPTEQLTYRMIATEIPDATTPEEGGQVQVALALSLPIFITPLNAKTELDCTLQQDAAAAPKVLCENIGNAYAQPRELVLSNAAGEALTTIEPANYILPGVKLVYDLPESDINIAEAGKLQVTMDDNSQFIFDLKNPE